MPKYVRARVSFVAGDKDRQKRRIDAGRILPANDPVVRGRSEMFEELDDGLAPVVEQATAAPGERRNVRTRSKNKAAESAAAETPQASDEEV